MIKLFIHKPLFRLLSPVFSGVVSYLLILLINNNIEQLQAQFLGEELYVCIGLSYLVQEFSRIILFLFKKLPQFTAPLISLLFQLLISLLLSAVVITIAITIYYKNVVGFSPSKNELIVFNSIFCSITFIYVLLYVSHQYLHKINTKKLENELLIKQNIEEEFKQFKRHINPNLLFESLEQLVLLCKENKEDVDDFVDCLSIIYRYILMSKKEQLVLAKTELTILKTLVKLYNYLPYTQVRLQENINTDFLMVPGTLLVAFEKIVRSTIVSKKKKMPLHITENELFFEIAYHPEEKIKSPLNDKSFTKIAQVYSIYSTQHIVVKEIDESKIISIPKLYLKS